MKIIGRADGYQYLIAARESEIAKLFGGTDKEWEQTKLRYMRPAYGNDQPSIVGLEINVDAAYAQLAWLRRRHTEFNEIINRLRSTAAAIEDSRPLFTAVTGDEGKAG